MKLETTPKLARSGDKEPIPASEFMQATLRAGAEVTVWSKPVAQDEFLAHGHGPEARDYAEAFVGLDLVATGNGDASAGDAIQGSAILAITNSGGNRVLASVTFDSLQELRDALAESRTDRIVEAVMAPYARPGRNLEIRIDADETSDGAEIDPAESSGGLYYTEFDR